MPSSPLHLEIIGPTRVVFDGHVDAVSLPGQLAPFTVLKNHAPLISLLTAGIIRYKVAETEREITVQGGFVRIANNTITICINRE